MVAFARWLPLMEIMRLASLTLWALFCSGAGVIIGPVARVFPILLEGTARTGGARGGLWAA